MKVSFVIDGFNLYHGIKDAQRNTDLRPLKWLDLRRLCESIISSGFGPGAVLSEIHYVSAYANHLAKLNPGVVFRHKSFVEAVEDTGVNAIIHKFKRKTTIATLDRCRFRMGRWRFRFPARWLKVIVTGHEEKETDVYIAVKMFELAQSGTDTIVIVSGDTDLRAAVDGVLRCYPGVQVYVAFPPLRFNKDLEKRATGIFRLSVELIAKHQLPDPYVTKNGREIAKPSRW